MTHSKKNGISRRAFIYLSGLLAAGLGSNPKSLAQGLSNKSSKVSEWNKLLAEINQFPLLEAIFARRSRRFGWGMEIPKGPMQYKSKLPPTPLDEFERAVIIASGLGVSGWHNGIPYSAAQDGLCDYSLRYTGRTFPGAAGIGNVDLFYTDDSGTYFVSTKDADGKESWAEETLTNAEHLIKEVEAKTTQISNERVSPPRAAPHYSAHNLWNGNTEGSTLFIPAANVSEQLLAFLFIVVGSGYTVFDDNNQQNAGSLDKFIKDGLIDQKRKYPLSYLEQYVLSTSAVEMGMLGHNMALSLQPLGLGGWFYSGINPFSVMGLSASKGIPGLGFDFERKEGWGVPNPVGIEGLYECYGPPFHADMRAATESLLDKKYGPGGTYDSNTPGPFQDSNMKGQASRPNDAIVDCVVEVAQYIYDTYGKFPGTVPSIFVRYYVQAHRLDIDFYDKHFKSASYLDTHKSNATRWMKKILNRS